MRVPKATPENFSTVAEAYGQLGGEVDVILDDGSARLNVSSTILDLTEKEPRIIA